ncbi:MAG: hypothetical protein ACE367_10570 [Acidimicrobiales bacterium]
MGRQGSRRPSINTSADAVLRRLDQEFTTDPSGARDFARAHLRPIAVGAIIAGAALVAAALLAPIIVAVFGGLVVATGVAMATRFEDEDRVTGIDRLRRRCRRRIGRVVRRRRHRRHRSKAPTAPIGCRVAPWLFPDPRKRDG